MPAIAGRGAGGPRSRSQILHSCTANVRGMLVAATRRAFPPHTCASGQAPHGTAHPTVRGRRLSAIPCSADVSGDARHGRGRGDDGGIVVMLEPNQRRLTAIVSLGPRSVSVTRRIGVARTGCFGTGRQQLSDARSSTWGSPRSDARLPGQNSRSASKCDRREAPRRGALTLSRPSAPSGSGIPRWLHSARCQLNVGVPDR